MKKFLVLITITLLIINSCKPNQNKMNKIVFLHHSIGSCIWVGNTNKYLYKLSKYGDVQKLFKNFNKSNKTNYNIVECSFPKQIPYGWENYPYDYYNIWVKNAGEKPHMDEPTLEILTKEFDVIIFKHCFPVSRISEDTGSPDINSPEKRIENYKLQYLALKQKLHSFPNNKFIVWTPAACTKNQMTEEQAKRTNQFYNWMINEWNEEKDNIYIWDFYKYETEGGLYLLDKNALDPNNSHPNKQFSAKIAPLFCQFVIDVIKSESEL
jgi:hypothetical protein